MTEMIERVAGAIAAHFPPFDPQSTAYERAAFDAITAMRKPSDEQVVAGIQEVPWGGPSEKTARAVYRAMIDAALSEGA